MGSGHWSAHTYASTISHTATTKGVNAVFAYSGATSSAPRSTWAAHKTLDPVDITTRESRDSDDHPLSTPIAVAFDVTGSMREVPKHLVVKLGGLFGLLLRKGYLEDPQILVGAIGDATSDRVPTQVSQFESDNRIDENLANLFLEGGGGGSLQESYELFLYFMARHTSTDSWEKRGKKGYCFIIGDEAAYDTVKPSEVKAVFGEDIEAPIPLKDIVAEVQERWELFFIIPEGTSYFGQAWHKGFWSPLLGQRYIELPHSKDGNGGHVDAMESVCETIASTIGLLEDIIDLDDIDADLASIGSKASGSVTKALATLGASRGGGGSVVVTDAPEDLSEGDSDETERL